MGEGRTGPFRDAPNWLIWTMAFINRVGFPILVCLYLGYVQVTGMPKIVQAINEIRVTMEEVKKSIDENTRVLKSWKGPRYRHED